MIRSKLPFARLAIPAIVLLCLGVACQLTRDMPSVDTLSLVGSGTAALESGNYDTAIDHFTQAIENDPNSPVAYSYRGDAYAAKGDHERAIADYDKVIELDPTRAATYNSRGLSYAFLGDYERAIADFDRAIELDQTHWEVYYHRGQAYAILGDKTRAVADLEKALELGPPSEDEQVVEELLDGLP